MRELFYKIPINHSFSIFEYFEITQYFFFSFSLKIFVYKVLDSCFENFLKESLGNLGTEKNR